MTVKNLENEYSKLWKPGGILGIELFEASFLNHVFSKHIHESYTIGINNGGAGVFSCNGNIWNAVNGTINLINPEAEHNGKSLKTQRWIYRDIYIQKNYVSKILRHLNCKDDRLPVFEKAVVNDCELNRSLNMLFQILSFEESILHKETEILNVFTLLFSRYSNEDLKIKSASKEPRAIKLVKEFICTNFNEEIRLDTLTEICGLSPYYLIRTFKKYVGLPPHSFQNHIRLKNSKKLLLKGKPLSEIAVENGFFDQSHFSRHFKKTYGVSPGKYQKSNYVQSN